MKLIQNHFVILCFSFAFMSCSQNPSTGSREEDEKKLLALHEQGRDAHFNKKAKLLVDQFAREMYSVNKGKISRGEAEGAAKSFQKYFDAVEFKKWDDVNPPIVRFSDDGSLGYIIVDKLVVLETKDSTGTRKEQTTHFAWVSIYRKQEDGNYKLECITSTNEPAVVKDVD
jgi:hypothetical protein